MDGDVSFRGNTPTVPPIHCRGGCHIVICECFPPDFPNLRDLTPLRHPSSMRLTAGVYGPLELCPTGTVARGFRVRHSSSQELHVGIAGVHLLCEGSHGAADRYADVRNKYVVSNEVEKSFR